MSARQDSVKLALDAQDPVAELERRGWTYTGTRQKLRWIRTMPCQPASIGRSYIVDDPSQCQVFYHDGYNNYRPVMESLSTDAVLLDWDIAVSREDRIRFEQHIADDPDIVQIAPYLLYRGPKHMDIPADEPQYAAFPPEIIRASLPKVHPLYLPDAPPRDDVHIREGEPRAATFGFGMIYLPLAVVRRFLEECHVRQVTDGAFSIWHYRVLQKETPVHWDVRPIHLNYSM